MPRALLALALATVQLGCGDGPVKGVPSPTSSSARGAVVVGVTAPPASLDPHRLNEFMSFNVLSNVYEGLVGLDAWLRVESALAVSWTSPDDRHWRFELRPGVVFHQELMRASTPASVSGRGAWAPLRIPEPDTANAARERRNGIGKQAQFDLGCTRHHRGLEDSPNNWSPAAV